MEAIGEFVPDQAPWAGPAVDSRLPRLAAVSGTAEAATGSAVGAVVDSALALLRASVSTAVEDVARFGLAEAADFAGGVEDLSRTVEYLQIVAAAAVDRTRKESAGTPLAVEGWGAEAAAPAGWLTGWTQEPDAGSGGADSGTHTGSDDGTGSGTDHRGGDLARPVAMAAAADDGCRNATEFLRARLRISAPEAKRRLTLAAELLPRTGTAGHTEPPVRAELAAAVASGTVASRTATIITLALDRVRHTSHPEAAATMEHALTMTAIENDADFLARIARRWTEALDQDGAEPSEELLRRIQGAFIRKPRHGLHHLEIFATTDQFEHLVTVMNTATNPRTGPGADPGPGQGADASAGADTGAGPHSVAEFSSIGSAGGGMDGRVGLDSVDEIRDGNGLAVGASSSSAAAVSGAVGGDVFAETGAADRLDLRSRPQRLLDGLVGGCKVALATGGLPAAGGLRPQVMATIDYRDLLQRLGGAGAPNGTGPHHEGTGSLTFTGPITASTVRKIACDADIIPVVLGGEGRILDIGRASRVFPPHVRKALTARDQGCAFPQCTIPAPWCEAHHIDYWSRGGSTGTDNGTLLCSHHHHLIHKEQWSIRIRSGIPWFIPPPHVDPGRVPRRNSYFRLD